MTRARDHSNWIPMRCNLKRHPRFLALAELLGIEDRDNLGKSALVGWLHDLWSYCWSDKLRRFDYLEDIHRGAEVPMKVLEAMTDKSVGWIRRVSPTSEEKQQRIDRGFTNEEAEAKWFEVGIWSPAKGSGYKQTNRQTNTTSSDEQESNEATNAGGLAEVSNGRPAPPPKIDQATQNACNVIAQRRQQDRRQRKLEATT